jgi:hypothetical protein
MARARARKNNPVEVSRQTHLDDLVPAGRDDDGDDGVGRESDARDPLRVAVLGDVELALAEGVPQLDGAVTRGRDDLSVVGGKGDAGGGSAFELAQ